MADAHVHSNPVDREWPVTLCLSNNAAHALAIFLSQQSHRPGGIHDILKEISDHLDAKLVGDPTSRRHIIERGGDTAKEHTWNPRTSTTTTMTSASTSQTTQPTSI